MLERAILAVACERTEPELMRLFPESEFQQATQTLVAIKQITEDKQMYDATEKARRVAANCNRAPVSTTPPHGLAFFNRNLSRKSGLLRKQKDRTPVDVAGENLRKTMVDD